MEQRKKVAFLTLGCKTNQYETNGMIQKFIEAGYEICDLNENPDIYVVNTCTVTNIADRKSRQSLRRIKNKNNTIIVAVGCYAQIAKEELQKMSEIDIVLGNKEKKDIVEYVEEYLKIVANKKMQPLVVVKNTITNSDEQKNNVKELSAKGTIVEVGDISKQEEFDEYGCVTYTERARTEIKIQDGCNNFCTYCAIPYIRGLFISRPMEEIIKEAENLARQGIKELIVIAQDTTKYGVDLYGKSKLAELLKKLCKIDGIHWIRFLYSYPEGITDELIQVVKTQEKIAKYFDIPIQHISDEVLKRMNRKTSKQNIEKLISKIREEIPDVTLRTSLIVGFPGETKEQFEELYDFVEKAKFDKLGVFEYSKEDGTPASKMPNQIHHMTKKSRLNKIMSLQQQISREKMKAKIGTKQEVLIEAKSFDRKYVIGRTKFDAPDIDGVVYIKNTDLKLKQFVTCNITDFRDYDLVGETKLV